MHCNIDNQWSFWNKLMYSQEDYMHGKGDFPFSYDSKRFSIYYINEFYIVD